MSDFGSSVTTQGISGWSKSPRGKSFSPPPAPTDSKDDNFKMYEDTKFIDKRITYKFSGKKKENRAATEPFEQNDGGLLKGIVNFTGRSCTRQKYAGSGRNKEVFSMSDETLDTRMAVVENRMDTMEITTKETHTMVFDIKSRLDRQNGLLPHMAADIANLMEKIENTSISDAKTNTKLNVLWSAVGALGSALILAFVAYIFHVRL
jgi:hypothetical protein